MLQDVERRLEGKVSQKLENHVQYSIQYQGLIDKLIQSLENIFLIKLLRTITSENKEIDNT